MLRGVRKACAEHLATVSKVVTSESRHDTVTQCFCTLAQDESRWVYHSSFLSCPKVHTSSYLAALLSRIAADVLTQHLHLPPACDAFASFKVRCAAYKNLGSLIATFVAEPPEYGKLLTTPGFPSTIVTCNKPTMLNLRCG